MLRSVLPLLVALVAITAIGALPVKVQPTTTTTTSTEQPPANHPDQHAEPSPQDQLSYSRYLQEVVQALETDEKFKEKLNKARQVDIRTGQIADELDNVHHHVRNQLDEIKRREVMRLRDLATQQYHLTNDIDTEHGRVPEHLDHENPHTFEIDDLRKLILKASNDLDEIDKQRRQEFKEYELQKEYEKTQKLAHLAEADRIKYQQQLDAAQAEHQQHEKVHYPGNRAQLEEVWEKQDHMEPEDFDPKNFFRLHDIDSNGFLDEYEVSALFQKELDKQYDPNNPNDDMRERAEEMERMREEVFRRADTNHDDLISFEEFLAETERSEFKEDPNWEGVDDKKQFTHDEYLAYERQQQEHVQQLIAAGKLPANANMPHATYRGGNEIAHGADGQAAGQAYHEQQPPMHYQQQQQQQQQQYQQPQVQQQQQQYQQPPVQQQPQVQQQQYQQPQVQQQQQQLPQVQQQQQQPQVQQQPQQQYQQPPPVQQQQQQQQQQQPPPQQQQQQQPPPQAAAQHNNNAPPPAAVNQH